MSASIPFALRRATADDGPAFLEFCRRCFRNVPEWHGPRFLGRRWWRAVMRCEPAEVWLAVRSDEPRAGEIIGGQVICFDEALWDRTRIERYGSKAFRGLCLLLTPRLAWPVLRSVVRRRLSRRAASGAAADAALADSHVQPAEPPRKRCWSDLIAVDGSVRGAGVAQALMDRAEQRARRAGCDAIAGVVEATNIRSQRFLAKAGRVPAGTKGGRIIMQKVFDNPAPGGPDGAGAIEAAEETTLLPGEPQPRRSQADDMEV